MIEILIHGAGNYYKLFQCEKCGCIFRSTEYNRNVEYGYIARCPECNFPNIELTTKKLQELKEPIKELIQERLSKEC